jgi:hypothetical protein
MPEPNDPSSRPDYRGILISRGASLRIPSGGLTLSIEEDGRISAGPLRVELSLDMVGHWMGIALDQLVLCRAARNAHLAIEEKDGAHIGDHLEAECVAGMVSIMSAATAIDAFYAALKERSHRVAGIHISKRGRSARPRIVSEAFRREFKYGPTSRVQIAAALRELYKFRDWSVHPSAKFTAPVRHPDVPSLVEWRYVAFRFENALGAVRIALSMLVQLPGFVRQPQSAVGKYLEGSERTREELHTRWRELFGPLTEADVAASATKAGRSA